MHQRIQLPTVGAHTRIVVTQLLEQLHQRGFGDAVFVAAIGLHQANQQVHGLGILLLQYPTIMKACVGLTEAAGLATIIG